MVNVISRVSRRRTLTFGPRRGLALALLAFAPSALGWAGGDACPAHLFIVARSKNANIVAYDANRGPGGEFKAAEPVVAYWLLDGEKGKREELTRMQRERAYGVEVVAGDGPSKPGTFTVGFKARGNRRLTVRVLDGCPVATTPIGGREGILRRLFVKSKEDSMLPKVEYVEFFGEDLETRAPLYEKLVPEN